MLLDASLYWTFTIAVLVLMLKPGPVMVTCMALAADGRTKSIISFLVGHAFFRIFMYFFLLLTLSKLPAGFGIVFLFMKGIASVLFVVSGLKGLQQHFDKDEEDTKALKKKIKPKSVIHNFFMGGFLVLSNPYNYIFILAVIPAIFSTTYFSILDITLINIIVIVIDFIVNGAYIIPILYYREKIFSAERLAKLKIVTSFLLILIGFYIFSTLFFDDTLIQTNLLSG